MVAGLRAAGRKVFAINPFAVSRYRDRYRSSRGKSDAFDAMVLGNILRTDIDNYRPLPDDSFEVQTLRVFTRAQQDAVWESHEIANRIRTLLKTFFLAALSAFDRGGRHRARAATTAHRTPCRNRGPHRTARIPQHGYRLRPSRSAARTAVEPRKGLPASDLVQPCLQHTALRDRESGGAKFDGDLTVPNRKLPNSHPARATRDGLGHAEFRTFDAEGVKGAEPNGPSTWPPR
nr:transposase [Nocardia nova]